MHKNSKGGGFNAAAQGFIMRLQERDIEIFDLIRRFHCLQVSQLVLLLDWHPKVCQRRIRKLIKEDYLRTVPMPTIKPGKPPYLIYLGAKGAELIGAVVEKPRLNRSLTHELKNNDLLINVLISFKESEIKCEVLPEHVLRQKKLDVIPDGAFALQKESRKVLFILENCSGSEIISSPSLNEDIENKIIRHVEIFKNNNIGIYSNYFDHEFNRFRLLYVSNNYQRLSTISEVIEKHDELGFIWITSLNKFIKDITGSIWLVPAKNQDNLSIIG